jgi:hypothetical protein
MEMPELIDIEFGGQVSAAKSRLMHRFRESTKRMAGQGTPQKSSIDEQLRENDRR